MGLALLREWEGQSRRYADGTDIGECSIKDFIRNVLFFVITGLCGGIGTCGKHSDSRGDP